MWELQGKYKFHQYQVVGRHLPSEKEENPTVYRMKLWAEDPVRAKSKFWCVSAAAAGSYFDWDLGVGSLQTSVFFAFERCIVLSLARLPTYLCVRIAGKQSHIADFHHILEPRKGGNKIEAWKRNWEPEKAGG